MKRLVILAAVLAICGASALAQASEPKAEDGSGPKPEPVKLFNGEDLSNWKLFLPDENADPAKTWIVKDGIVYCTGEPAGYMRTKKQYSDYTLYLQWRFPGAPGNSGVLLHAQEPDKVWPKSIEAQLHHSDAGDFWVIEGTEFREHKEGDTKRVKGRRTIKHEQSSEKPVGEWNQYRIVCKGDTIKVYVNNVLQNEAHDCTVASGYIGLQSEGAPIEFRDIRLVPMK
jgi:hypothetical protein